MDSAYNSIKVLIADVQHVYRGMLRRALSLTHDVRVVGEAFDCSGVVALTAQFQPQVILMDPMLPLGSELAGLRAAAYPMPTPEIIAMLHSIEKGQVMASLRLGAHGILLKTVTPSQLATGIREVASGNYLFGGPAMGMVVQLLRDLLGDHRPASPTAHYALTHRELEIIAKVGAGLSNREVAQFFSISERTVKHHLTNIFSKVGVSSRLALALFAVDHRLLSSTDTRDTGSRSDARSIRPNGSAPHLLVTE